MINSVFAGYYADIDIFLEDDGNVIIEGISNYPNLLTEQPNPNYTSKKGKYWLFNMTMDETFDEFIYRLHMPKDLDINYLKTRHLSRIDQDDSITVIGTGRDESLVILVQYSINRLENNNYLISIFLSIIILILLAAYFFFFHKKKKTKRIDPAFLTERQKIIYDILKKSKKPLTQKYIEEKTNLPKSSVSRNIESMVRKDIISKEKVGMSNRLTLKN
ncbi:hypothetical protein C0585_06760 [Candidatus Woesearchaeota archaeon]|nr:MAG: hypothetical protein C0585_06760 [Candidatus Woesearchaeota archaeon]